MPLDPVPQDRAVEFIRGSHRWGRWFTPTRFTGVDYQRDDQGFEMDLSEGVLHAGPGPAAPARRRA